MFMHSLECYFAIYIPSCKATMEINNKITLSRECMNILPLYIHQYVSYTTYTHTSRVSCQKGPTRHAYIRQIGPFWQGILDMTMEHYICNNSLSFSIYSVFRELMFDNSMSVVTVYVILTLDSCFNWLSIGLHPDKGAFSGVAHNLLANLKTWFNCRNFRPSLVLLFLGRLCNVSPSALFICLFRP